jgi:enoyl-CoA hydratase
VTTGLQHERDGRVLVLTIDRPEVRNALDPATLDAIAAALTDAALDAAIGAVVLTGAGYESFSSGMDLGALEHDRAEAARASRAFDAVMRDGDRIPIVAAVAGNAIGGGFEIALRCDLVVAADDVVFGLPEVARGLVPGGGGTLLPSRVSLAVALELGLTGEPITVQRAYSLGLVNRVVPRADVLSSAIALASRIAANAPGAVAATRRLMWVTATDGAGAGLTALREQPPSATRDREAVEGLAAFFEKRAPRWDVDADGM